MTEEQKPKKIVKGEKTAPCGCHMVEFSDDTTQISPCAPCGLTEVARNLGQAAQVLAAVALRIRQDQQNQMMMRAVAAATKKGPQGVVGS